MNEIGVLLFDGIYLLLSHSLGCAIELAHLLLKLLSLTSIKHTDILLLLSTESFGKVLLEQSHFGCSASLAHGGHVGVEGDSTNLHIGEFSLDPRPNLVLGDACFGVVS